MPKILNVGDDIKGLRETLCRAQAYVQKSMPERTWRAHVERLQALIDECDVHRPLGPDGVHGDLHTETCGCEDRGHGTWCRHACCRYNLISVYGGSCEVCGHTYPRPKAYVMGVDA